MASTIAVPDVPSTGGQLFYCHQCSHQWRKTEGSDFLCPQCREGFIEEINDRANEQLEPRERDSDPIYSLIHRIISDLEPARTTRIRETTTNRRNRSRSPRMFVVGSSNTAEPSPSFRQHVIDSSVHFDLDDFMSSFLSSHRSHPVSERRLQEISKEAITIEQESSQCSICFDEFKVAESNVRKLPCNHLFHENCIFPWLRLNGTCPVCRARLQTPAEDEQPQVTPPVSFDHILRLMRLRRTTIRRVRERYEASTSSGSRSAASSRSSTESTRRRPQSVDSPTVANLRPLRRRRPARTNLMSDVEVVETQMPSRRLRARVTRSQTIPFVDLTTSSRTISPSAMEIVDSESSLSSISSSSSSSSGSSFNSSDSPAQEQESPARSDSFFEVGDRLEDFVDDLDTTDEE